MLRMNEPHDARQAGDVSGVVDAEIVRADATSGVTAAASVITSAARDRRGCRITNASRSRARRRSSTRTRRHDDAVGKRQGAESQGVEQLRHRLRICDAAGLTFSGYFVECGRADPRLSWRALAFLPHPPYLPTCPLCYAAPSARSPRARDRVLGKLFVQPDAFDRRSIAATAGRSARR